MAMRPNIDSIKFHRNSRRQFRYFKVCLTISICKWFYWCQGVVLPYVNIHSRTWIWIRLNIRWKCLQITCQREMNHTRVVGGTRECDNRSEEKEITILGLSTVQTFHRNQTGATCGANGEYSEPHSIQLLAQASQVFKGLHYCWATVFL